MRLSSDRDPNTWNLISSEMIIPNDAQFVVVSLTARKSGPDSILANTSSYYADDLELFLSFDNKANDRAHLTIAGTYLYRKNSFLTTIQYLLTYIMQHPLDLVDEVILCPLPVLFSKVFIQGADWPTYGGPHNNHYSEGDLCGWIGMKNQNFCGSTRWG